VIKNFIHDILKAFADFFSQVIVAFFNGIKNAITSFFGAVFKALKGAADWMVDGAEYWRKTISSQLSSRPFLGVFFALTVGLCLLVAGYLLTHPQALLALKGLSTA
jgi:hypothetical protein